MWSIFTENLDRCVFTGSGDVERHHVFGAFNRARSEKYGFVIPVRPDLHPNGAQGTEHARKDLDPWMKAECQRYYESHYGTREEFISEFGRNYILGEPSDGLDLDGLF